MIIPKGRRDDNIEAPRFISVDNLLKKYGVDRGSKFPYVTGMS